MWPAFWMLGDNIGSVGWPNSGEMDIMENIGREPSTNHGSLHGPGYSGGNSLTGTYAINGTLADAFHTFTLDWGPGSAQFYVDGNLYETRTPADTNGNPWVFDHPFFMLLNVAVGGGWPGSPNGSNAQQWTRPGDGTIRALGKCLDVPGGSTANGALMQIYDCNGTGAQQWRVEAAQDIANVAANKCLNVVGGNSADGTRTEIRDCNGAASQKWAVT
jgi:hypothetical protein